MKAQSILIALLICTATYAQTGQVNPEAKIFKRSTMIEKERPELNEETKALISAYRRNPSQENYDALKAQVQENYDRVIERKVQKLNELKKEGARSETIEQMEGIVAEVIADRDHRVAQTMLRFTDRRMGPGSRTPREGFLPLIGGGEKVWVAYAPVTNEEYAKFDESHSFPAGHGKYPVTNVSHEDATAYCAWLSSKSDALFRLPTEDEWELAAGHMPKDADFNCGENDSLTPVDQYAGTKGACGGIDFWGNCWEWTTTIGTDGKNIVKGGAWDSSRDCCRTEYSDDTRDSSQGYANVGFRVVRTGI